MGDGIPRLPPYDGSDESFEKIVDHEQAAELATSLLDPGLVARGRSLGEELDEIFTRTVAIGERLSAFLEDTISAEEDAFSFRGHAVAHGVDRSMTHATVERAEELWKSWSGVNGVWARAYRLVKLVNDALGIENGDVVNEEKINAGLAEERGR